MPDQMWQWLDDFPNQVKHAAALGQNWKLEGIDQPDGIAFLGIGGSAIGATLIQNLYSGAMRCPVVVQRGDRPPSWLKPGCVAVAISYSGETKETLTACKSALDMGAQGITISSGGTLAKLAEQKNLPHLIIPSGMEPRAALGYSSIPLIYLLQKIGAIPSDDLPVASLVKILESLRVEWGDSVGTAAGIARRLMKRLPIIVGGGIHADVARRFQAQLAENAKALAVTFEIPEALHNLVEILGTQEIESFRPIAIYLDDSDNPEYLISLQRHVRTAFQEAGVEGIVIPAQGKAPIERLYSLIHKIDWVSYHLAKLRGVNPAKIPVITSIKLKSSVT